MSEQLVKVLEHIASANKHAPCSDCRYYIGLAVAALAAHRAAQAEPARRPYCCERCEREAQVADQAERDDTCPGCRGSGLASQWAQDQDGHEIELADSCDQCRGTGKVPVQGERDDEASSEDFDAAMLRTLLAQQREEAIALLQSIEHERDKAEQLLERLVSAIDPVQALPGFAVAEFSLAQIADQIKQHVAARRAARGEG